MMRRLFIPILVLVAVASGIVWYSARRAPLTTPGANVVLISIDTCRADHLSCYGDRDPMTTPCIDAFARTAVLFENVISPVPLTLPAHCSMLTGLTPPAHGVRDNISYRLAESASTLAELLRERGYRTGAIIGAAVLDSQTGMSQGFDVYDDQVGVTMTQAGARPERRGDEVSRLAEAWLAGHSSEPFFLFVHFFDPHYPYDPPEPFASRFAGDPYAGEVAFADQCVGTVIDKLKRLDLYDSSLIIIVGDHGEGLGEHGEPEHGYFIYHSTTKVPMVIKAPDGRGTTRVVDIVSLTDILPTVLAQVGAPMPPGVKGEDLSPYLSSTRTAHRERLLYSESLTPTRYGCSSLLAVETLRWKYIQASRSELYDLTYDPDEQRNIVEEHRNRARAMQAQLQSVLEESLGKGSGRTTTASSDHIDQLRALGYVGDPVEESFDFDADNEDPKDFIAAYVQIQEIDECRIRNDRARAKHLAEELLAVRPDIVQTRRTLARFAMEDGDDQTAIAHYTELVTSAPDFDEAAGWHNNLGILLGRQGRFDEAVEHYREALHQAQQASRDVALGLPQDRHSAYVASVMYSAHLNLGNVLLERGQIDAATNEYAAAIRMQPSSATAHTRLAIALSELGQLDQAIEMFQRALRLDPQHPTARQELDKVLNHRRHRD